MPESERCANCLFFDALPDRGYGYCLRFPPTPITDEGRGTATFVRPEVDDSSWCGEWESHENHINADGEDGNG